MKPLKGGVICDHEMTVRLLQAVFRRATQSGLFTPKPRLVVSVPSGITEVEERTVINAAIEAGARRVYLIEEPLAAALGAGLDISGPSGHMVVDIGAGTTDVAILSMNGVAVSGSSKVAGDTFDDLIVRYLRREHSLNIGQTTAEDIKMQIGTVVRPTKDTYMEVSGYDISTGKPRTHTVSSSEIYRVLQRPARQVADLILTVLEETTPELVGDVFKNGITLTGGMAQLTGMAQLVTEVTGIECVVADDPASCVALGCGKSLAWINHMQEGPVNLARRRLMNKQF
jgi:rod shape-determining protein MreB